MWASWVDGRPIVHVAGELDIANAPLLEQYLLGFLDDGVREVLLDLSDLTYTDSIGIKTLLTAASMCERDGGSLRIIRISRAVARILEIVQLRSLLAPEC